MPNFSTQAFVLGVVSGMRATFGPALVTHKLSRQVKSRQVQPRLGRLEFMRSPKTASFFKVAAAGEVIADKLPQTPARTQPGPLLGRTLSGALCGAALGRSMGQGARSGAVVGALGAAVGSYAFYYLRRNLTHGQGLPDLPVALAEDALALGGGALVLND